MGTGNSTEKIPLALMKNTNGADPQWIDKAPANFKDHVTLSETAVANTVSFNMIIDEFKCTDVGKYECQIYTFDETLIATSELHAKGRYLQHTQ